MTPKDTPDLIPSSSEMLPPGGFQASRSELLSSRLLLVFVAILQVVVAWHFRSLVWDDSAITVGFSHSLATSGHIAPTPTSDIVEGYSTTLWMLLLAAVGVVVRSAPALLNVARVTTLLLNLLNLYLVRRWVMTWGDELLGNLASGVLGCFMFYETINGMETPLLMTLLLLMALLRKRYRLYLLLGAAVVLTRFEALWMLIPFVLFDRREDRALRSAAVWSGVFIAAEFFRLAYFHALIPNTITAKRHPPYTFATAHDELMRHVHEAEYILRYLIPFAFLAAVPLAIDRWRRGASPNRQQLDVLRLPALLTLFGFILSTAIGTNWGPPMRSFYAAWPFALALVFAPLMWSSRSGARRLAVLLIVGLSLWITRVRWHEMAVEGKPAYMPGATVGAVYATARNITDVKARMSATALVYAGPDMGGILIGTSGVRVVDLGLLCNRTLAVKGFGVMRSYVFGSESPDLIEVHEPWTTASGLGTIPEFQRDYLPFIVRGETFFIRRDDLQRIPAREITLIPLAQSGLRSSAAADQPLDSLFDQVAFLK